MRRFFALLIPILIALTGLLEIEQVKEKINEQYPSAKPYIIGFCCISALLSFIFASYLPQVRYEKLAAKRWPLLSEAVDAILLDYIAYELNANIMVTKRKFVHNFYPKKENDTKKRITFFGKVFKVIWEYQKIDPTFKMAEHQGLAGQILNKSSKITFTNNPTADTFKFHQDQKEKLKGLKIVICCPLEIRKRGNVYHVGLLNIESKNPESVKLLEGENWQKFQDKLNKLSKICSYLT